MFDPADIAKTLQLAINSNYLRANCWVSYDEEEEPAQWRCKIDTGAMKTLLPQRFWQKFENHLDIENCPETMVRGVGGRSLRAREVSLHLMIDSSDCKGMPIDLGACDVLLAYDGDAAEADESRPLHPGETENDRVRPLQHVLLGLGGGPLKHGGLCIDWMEQKAFLICCKF